MSRIEKPLSPTTLVPQRDMLPTYDVRDLIPSGARAQLVLDDQNYVLSITRSGKLILTK